MAVERTRAGSRRSQRSFRTSYDDTRYRKPLGDRIKDCCRSTIAFMFSNVGVCGLMVGYTIMGAFLFQKIEGPNEREKFYSVAVSRNETIKRLWNITVAYNTLYPDNWTKSVADEVGQYQKYIVEMVRDGWDGNDGSQGSRQWSTEGGFLYSLTVITTIGYGHIVPRTDIGKVVTIFYTIFGMPVFLLYMANMGDILAKSLKWLYAKVCICRKTENHYDTSVVYRAADTILRSTAIPNLLPPADEFSEPRRGMPYPAQEDFDDEFEDERQIRPVRDQIPRQRSARYSQYGGRSREMEDDDDPYGELPERGRNYACGESSEEMRDYSLHEISQREREFSYREMSEREQQYYGRHISSRDPDLMYMDDGEVSIETRSGSRSEKMDVASVNIPLTVSLLIMIALLYGGTKLFQSYEGWDGLTSFYFCFISLTTIGFGDYVPGSSVEATADGNRTSFIYCSVYLMFGLALLSMCFNLMQEEVVHKVTTCIRSISVIRKKDPD